MADGGDIITMISEWIREYGGPAMLACLGATVQCLRGPWRGWRNLLISNATAAFGGIICALILPHYVPPDVAAGVAGIVGYSGGTLIDAIVDRVRHDIGTIGPGGTDSE